MIWKKIFLLLIALMLISPVFADDVDGWAKFDDVDKAWDGQKIITNKQYEDVINALEERKNRKENRKRERAIRKYHGDSLHENMHVHNDKIESQTPFEEEEDCQLINIPVDFILDGKVIERGFYRIIGEKQENTVFINLYQSHQLIAKIKARETNDDFEQEFIQFAKLLPYNDSYMKLIFGCLEFNAYAFINIIDTQCCSSL